MFTASWIPSLASTILRGEGMCMHNGCGGAAAYGKEGEKHFAFGEDRRHLGNVSKNFVFCFAFLSVCNTLPSAKIGGTSEM